MKMGAKMTKQKPKKASNHIFAIKLHINLD